MSIMIVDASMAAGRLLVDEQNAEAEAVLDALKASAASVPFLKAERRLAIGARTEGVALLGAFANGAVAP